MGSSIRISLQALLGQEEITVVFKSVRSEDSYEDDHDPLIENIAEVTFVSNYRTQAYVFDYSIHEGKVFLSRDFNYFRYENGSEQQMLLRWLYEHSICFEVLH